MISKKTSVWSLVCFVLSFTMTTSIATAADPVLTVKKGAQAKLVVDPKRTIRARLPGSMYSANMQYRLFDLRHWDKNTGKVKTSVSNMLKPMSGAFYRYPGGLSSNTHNFAAGTTPYATRLANRRQGKSVNQYSLFGPGEYLNFIKDVSKGTPWYTLNLIGGGHSGNPIEYSQWQVANTNQKVAQYVVSRTPNAPVRYYQLGNELDRNHFQWSHDKYVSRSLASINKIRAKDPKAKFVPFMREFSWRYKWPKSGTSTAEKYFKDVMTGLPMVNDFSLHYYFDGKLSPTAGYVSVPDVLTRINKAVTLAKKARGGNYNVWITEYGKRFFLSGGQPESGNSFDTALAVGDFLIATSQMPVVKGAFLQGLDGGNRNMFYDSNKATSAAWALRILARQPYTRVLASTTTSPNKSNYKGGYDVRAVALTNGAGNSLGVNAVNRSKQGVSLQVVYPPMKNRTVKQKIRSVSAPAGSNPKFVERNYKVVENPGSSTKRFSGTGAISIWLPAQSVMSITLD